MTLSWTMDKLGPMCRSAEDCALVAQAIWEPDGQDEACQKASFQWNAELDWKRLRIGYLKDDFEKPWEPPVVTLADDATDDEKRPSSAGRRMSRNNASAASTIASSIWARSMC
jgi:Asp-tRNA(Asn)/Glu-tRNA(Gln) amidotransferase A subunit family amidase